jgi:hypothetical protein
MISLATMSRQPVQDAWTLDQLNAELTINLGMAIDQSTHSSYTSALNSYITFCCLHGFNIEPTPHTLALYVTFQSVHINPKSVDTYLSGICNQIEIHFPNVQNARKSMLVSHALQGAKHRFGVPTLCKLPLTKANLLEVLNTYQPSPSHDDKLFLAQLFIGTNCLLRLKELVWLDNHSLQDYCKVSMCHSVQSSHDSISFWLPSHKADQFFEGNCLFIRSSSTKNYCLFNSYLSLHNSIFCACPKLWLLSNGTIPTWRWFINHLHHFFPNSIAGQSMHASGVTALTEAGTPPPLIQAAGWWSTNTFNHYVQKSPFLSETLLLERGPYTASFSI